MVRLTECELNKIFDVLADWEHILQAEKVDVVRLTDELDMGGP